MKLINVYDRQLRLIAKLENAMNVAYETPLNELWSASFVLPMDDPKNALCKHYNFIEVFDNDERVDLFRIMPTLTSKNAAAQTVSYQCEHVLATLIDDSFDTYRQWTNVATQTVLVQMLQYQEVQRWVLGTCQFSRLFSYAVEKEDILPVIFGVPKVFNQQYQWTFDTTVYPWRLNLLEASTQVVGEARWGHNVTGITKESDPIPIATRIYPYGYGEGVNQLNIKKVNPTGKNYIEAEQSILDEYGIIKYMWVDRRFENGLQLLEAARAKLTELKRPKVTYTINVEDFRSLGDLNRFDVGKLVRIHDEDFGTLIVRVRNFSKSDVTGNPTRCFVEIGDRKDDMGTTQADMERRQDINDTYPQGATNIDSHPYCDNADQSHPAVIRFYLDPGLRNINSLKLSYETDRFRAYSRATEGGGATVTTTSSGGAIVDSTSSGGGSTQTSSSGGGSTQTSSSGGGVSTSTQSGGGAAPTSSAGGDHNHKLFVGRSFALPPVGNQGFAFRLEGGGTVGVQIPVDQMVTGDVVTETSSGDHIHTVSVPPHSHDFSTPNHTHSVTVPSHTHSVSIPNHTHQINIPNHTHQITLPDHTHEIEHGIFELSTLPTAVTVKVDGNVVPGLTALNVTDFNIIPFLNVDSGGQVTRGAWHTVEITPNNLARITADVISRVFIQSREGGLF